MRFPGIIPAVMTPFTGADTVDVDALRANIAFMLEHGVHGLVANGTMGEAGSLSDDERRVVVRECVLAAGGNIPVLVGISAGATAIACRHARSAREVHADAVMCLPPLNYRGDVEEHIAHFAAVADEGLPVMLYNNPEASGVDLTPAQIAQIAAAVPGIVAVKECSGDARRIAALVGMTEVDVLVGGDDWALEGLAAGAGGWVSGVANAAPAQCVALYEHLLAGRLEEARELNQRLLPLSRLDMTPHLVQFFKGALDAVGLHGGASRPPRAPLSAANREILAAAVEALQAAPLPA